MRLTPSTSSRGYGFDPLEVSEGVSLGPFVRSEGVPYPLKSFEGVWHPSNFPEGYMNGILQVIITKIAEIFSARARGARDKVPNLSWCGAHQKNMYP